MALLKHGGCDSDNHTFEFRAASLMHGVALLLSLLAHAVALLLLSPEKHGAFFLLFRLLRVSERFRSVSHTSCLFGDIYRLGLEVYVSCHLIRRKLHQKRDMIPIVAKDLITLQFQAKNETG